MSCKRTQEGKTTLSAKQKKENKNKKKDEDLLSSLYDIEKGKTSRIKIEKTKERARKCKAPAQTDAGVGCQSRSTGFDFDRAD
jgi:hypothetical protein